jgi:hypothetical protein
MFWICVPKDDLPLLAAADGRPCVVNGHATTLRRDGNYLTYSDEEGKENRCKIMFDELMDNGLVQFNCKSHGADDEEYSVFTPFGTVKF